MKRLVEKNQKLRECWCISVSVSKATSKKMNYISMTCKRNWDIDYYELEADLIKSFQEMWANHWKRETDSEKILG